MSRVFFGQRESSVGARNARVQPVPQEGPARPTPSAVPLELLADAPRAKVGRMIHTVITTTRLGGGEGPAAWLAAGGAWAQAVGTVLAIVWTGVWARRAIDRDTRQRVAHSQSVIGWRRDAIDGCSRALKKAADEIRGMNVAQTPSVLFRLNGQTADDIRTAEIAVNYYLSLEEPIPHSLLTALTVAVQKMGGIRDLDRVITDEASKRAALALFETAAAAIGTLVAKLDYADVEVEV